MDIVGIGNEKLPSVIKDPFSKNKIVSINVFYYPPSGTYSTGASGSIKFQNGLTQGEQKFKGETFDDVVRQIKATLDNL